MMVILIISLIWYSSIYIFSSSLIQVQELVALGSLLDYLLDHPSSISPQFEFALWAGQIANGDYHFVISIVISSHL